MDADGAGPFCLANIGEGLCLAVIVRIRATAGKRLL